MEKVIEIKHAYVRRDGKYILDDISIDINRGERVAIIGPNGAGKSTLIDVIARRVYPLAKDEYKNKIFGEERWIIQDLKPLIGLVSPNSESFFNTSYTVREIVASGLFSSLGFDFHHKVSQDIWEKADKKIAKAGIEKLSSKQMNTLSSGEKRKVLLVRATITEPKVLLLDEASNGLDFPARAELRNIVSSYATEGRTVIMVTHELSEIIPEVSRAILMKDGHIIYDGKKEDALTEEKLSSLYNQRVNIAYKDGIYTAFC